MLCQLSYRGDRRVRARVGKAAPGPHTQQKQNLTKSMLDGIRTRNPQIRSLVRYPLRHEHLIERGPRGREPRERAVLPQKEKTRKEKKKNLHDT